MKGLKYNQFPLRTKCPNVFRQSNEIVLDAFAFDCKNIFFHEHALACVSFRIELAQVTNHQNR